MKKFFAVVLSSLLVAGIFSGCGQKKNVNKPEKVKKPATLERLRFGHFGVPNSRDLYIAKEKGFFETNGVDVELVNMKITELLSAIVGGQLDGGTSAAINALPAIAQGADIKLVASGARWERSENLAYVVVPKDSPVKTVKDLDGKTISGTAKGSCVWSWVKVAEKEYNITFSQYIGAPSVAESMPMLFAGTVDSSAFFPTSRLIDFKDKVRGILPLTAAAEIGCTSSYLWFSGEYIKKHPKVVRGFVNALQQAREYDKAHPIEGLRTMAKYGRYTFEDLKRGREAKTQYDFPPEMLVEVWQLERAQEVMRELGLLDRRLDVKKYVDTRFAKPVWKMRKGELDWLPKAK